MLSVDNMMLSDKTALSDNIFSFLENFTHSWKKQKVKLKYWPFQTVTGTGSTVPQQFHVSLKVS
jgi:hypothetical protein